MHCNSCWDFSAKLMAWVHDCS